MEFAFVGFVFILFLAVWIELGLSLFMQAALDRAVRKEARLIKIGTITSTGSATFKSNLCSDLAALMTCSLIQVNVTSGTTFASLSSNVSTTTANTMSTTGFAPGSSSSDVMVQVGYTRPLFFPIVSSVLGKNGYMFIYSSLAFQNEPF